MAATKKKYVKYHADGTLWAKGWTLGGKMEGKWEWFRKGGKSLMRSGSFKAGKRVGKWTTFSSAGKVVKVTMMKII